MVPVRAGHADRARGRAAFVGGAGRARGRRRLPACFVLGLASLAASLHLLLRDRRRGDLVMLVVILVLPMIGMLPQFLHEAGIATAGG